MDGWTRVHLVPLEVALRFFKVAFGCARARSCARSSAIPTGGLMADRSTRRSRDDERSRVSRRRARARMCGSNPCLSRRFDFRFVTVTNQDSTKHTRPPPSLRRTVDQTAHPDEGDASAHARVERRRNMKRDRCDADASSARAARARDVWMHHI